MTSSKRPTPWSRRPSPAPAPSISGPECGLAPALSLAPGPQPRDGLPENVTRNLQHPRCASPSPEPSVFIMSALRGTWGGRHSCAPLPRCSSRSTNGPRVRGDRKSQGAGRSRPRWALNLWATGSQLGAGFPERHSGVLWRSHRGPGEPRVGQARTEGEGTHPGPGPLPRRCRLAGALSSRGPPPAAGSGALSCLRAVCVSGPLLPRL